ncbi:MAG: hypothetical protein PVJ67_03815 [Candidatus Pacearchaeota archaeon]|jgi:hypothetical protein
MDKYERLRFNDYKKAGNIKCGRCGYAYNEHYKTKTVINKNINGEYKSYYVICPQNAKNAKNAKNVKNIKNEISKENRENKESEKDINKINTHGYKLQNSKKYKNILITRVPEEKEYADAELKMRGATMPIIDISKHAIDRASLRLKKIWKETRESDNEGLYSWLARIAEKALETEKIEKNADEMSDKIKYMNIQFIFDYSMATPVLLTVI